MEVLPGAAPGRVVLEVLLVLDLPAQVDEVRLAVAFGVDPDGAPGVEGGEVERDAVEVLVPAQGQGEGVRAKGRAWVRTWVRVRVRVRVWVRVWVWVWVRVRIWVGVSVRVSVSVRVWVWVWVRVSLRDRINEAPIIYHRAI